MSYMFYNCHSLTSLPDISKWDKNFLNDMSYVFYNCESISSLPNMTKFDIVNNNDESLISKNNLNNELNNKEINKNKERFNISTNDIDNYINKFQIKNIIKGILNIERNDINENIVLFYTKIKDGIEVYINKKKVEMVKENNNWKYKFQREGKYLFEIVFKGEIKNLRGFFEKIINLIYLDLSNLNTSRVMFSTCRKLKEIKGINKLNTSNVIDLNGIFQECNELEYLDLSNFNTSNVNNMKGMFYNCKKLKKNKRFT